MKVCALSAVFWILFVISETISAESIRILEILPREILPTPVVMELKFRAVVTAYSSARRQTSSHPRITASGKKVFDGVVACPRRFPFGTKVLIAGKIYECLDRLNLKYDSRFDIWKPNTRAARIFGKRELAIAVRGVPVPIAESAE
jgi:hypothetical protein